MVKFKKWVLGIIITLFLVTPLFATEYFVKNNDVVLQSSSVKVIHTFKHFDFCLVESDIPVGAEDIVLHCEEMENVTATDFKLEGTPWQLALSNSYLEYSRENNADFNNVVLVICDTGMTQHPDFSTRVIWDLAYNTFDNNKDITDVVGHGTAVAGMVIGEVTGNCPEIQMIPIKVSNDDGNATTSSIARAMDYVLDLYDKGVLTTERVVMNLSFGGWSQVRVEDYEEFFYAALAILQQRGIMYICAAGNDSLNVDIATYYPSKLIAPNFLAAAASTYEGKLAQFSNYGVERIEHASPGYGVLSTNTQGTYSVVYGTSFASPFLAGIVSMYLANDINATCPEVKEAIMKAAYGPYELKVRSKFPIAPSLLYDESVGGDDDDDDPDNPDYPIKDGGGGGCSINKQNNIFLLLLVLIMLLSNWRD